MDPNKPETSQSMVPVPQQPRQPRSLQGLLRFAMEATKAEDAPNESDYSPMDDERRLFLEEALRSMTLDVAEILRDSIKVLSDVDTIHAIRSGEALPAAVETAFNNLHEYIEDIDIANDFSRFGGFSIFPVCYGSESERVRTAASVVLGEVCQNNPYCQGRALELGLVSVLLKLIETEQGTTLKKCLFALSCAVREFDSACRELIKLGGCETLARLLTTATAAPCARAACLATRLIQIYPEAREPFIKDNVVTAVTKRLQAGRDEATEHLLGLLVSLTETKDPRVLKQCRDKSIDLPGFIMKNVIEIGLDNEALLEEKEYCYKLLKLCAAPDWNGASSNEDTADR